MSSPEHTPISPQDMGEHMMHNSRRLLRFAAPVAVAASLLLAGCVAGGDRDKSHDLISGTWDYMPGTTVKAESLHVKHTGLAILEMAEGGRPPKDPTYVENPPINLWGTHVEIDDADSVRLEAKLQNIKGQATLNLLNTPPTRYDERLEQPAGISIELEDGSAHVKVWDGTNSRPSTYEAQIGDTAKANISYEQNHDGSELRINGENIELSEAPLTDAVWFGFDAEKSWDLTGMKVKGDVEVVDTTKQTNKTAEPSSLSDTLEKNYDEKYVGTAIDSATLTSNPEYAAFVNKNFNEIEPEMEGKFQALQPQEGQFEFGELDGLVKWAENNDKQVHGHTLAFTEAYPQWLADKLQDPNISRAEVLDLLKTHIKTVVGRYDGNHGHGEVEAWDVVNEPFDPQNWSKLNTQNIWYEHLGEDYIAEAFNAAHEANPEAKLYINEWSLETDDDRLNAMVDLVKNLKSKGVPIHGIGFQAHFDEATLSDTHVMDEVYAGKIADRLNAFTDMGLEVRISEASVAENSNSKVQKDVYKLLMEACLDNDGCVGMNIWGATNSDYQGRYFYFTANGREQNPGNDAPTTQNKDGKIAFRPAWRGLQEAVSR